MANVKAGDLAKVVADPKGQGILGAHVLVVKDGTAVAKRFYRVTETNLIWECELLESRQYRTRYGPRLLKAGELAWFYDYCLRPIDPPEDEEDLWREDPIEDETKVAP